MIINFELTEYEIHIVYICLTIITYLIYLWLLGLFHYSKVSK